MPFYKCASGVQIENVHFIQINIKESLKIDRDGNFVNKYRPGT